MFNSPTDVILKAEMRTDPASSAGGDTDLHRMQLRLWHHISTLKTVHCRHPLIIFLSLYKNKRARTNHEEVEAVCSDSPSSRQKQHLGVDGWGHASSLGTWGWKKPAHGTRCHMYQACNPHQLHIRLLKPGGNREATGKYSDFADEKFEAQKAGESIWRETELPPRTHLEQQALPLSRQPIGSSRTALPGDKRSG